MMIVSVNRRAVDDDSLIEMIRYHYYDVTVAYDVILFLP